MAVNACLVFGGIWTTEVGPTTVVQIPASVPHSFAAADAVTALQLYTPPGPEQRFKKMK